MYKQVIAAEPYNYRVLRPFTASFTKAFSLYTNSRSELLPAVTLSVYSQSASLHLIAAFPLVRWVQIFSKPRKSNPHSLA